jgi:hypothetical protein
LQRWNEQQDEAMLPFALGFQNVYARHLGVTDRNYPCATVPWAHENERFLAQVVELHAAVFGDSSLPTG